MDWYVIAKTDRDEVCFLRGAVHARRGNSTISISGEWLDQLRQELGRDPNTFEEVENALRKNGFLS